jgi:serine/threonine protein kinase/Tol biopolymer transport system component
VTLTPGTRLGPYEVIAPIGAGGMGEVYRARDTRLDRTVALKILPQRTTTPEAKERFEREARAISSLNHPNICTLFDVGSEDGVSYLVMELVEGETLSARLAKGPLPLELALRLGATIAEALAKAHRHGIIHRDLKPANVMLTKGGAKLLDFGLARHAGESLTTHDSPTVIGAPITSAGMIVGTLPYMPPEQLEGKPTDVRSDIFALGAVLYEMVTGRRAFEAESQASLITKIMSQQPVSIASLQPITPPALERLVAKCLEKDPDDRWQSASDVASELRWIADGGAGQAVAPSRVRRLPWILAAASLLIAAIAVGMFFTRRTRTDTQTIRFVVPPPPGTTYRSTFMRNFAAVSPDGTRIAFASSGDGRLWVHSLARGTARDFEGTTGASSPFWSPDGRSAGFVTDGQIRTVNLRDGTVQTVCDVPPGERATAAWLGDGTIVYALLTGTTIYAVPASGGTPRKLFALAKYVGAGWPERIAKTNAFFFSAIDAHATALYVGDTSGKEPHKVADDIGRASYDAPYVTFAREGTLFAQRFDEDKQLLTGERIPIGSGNWFYRPIGQSQHSAAGDSLITLNGAIVRHAFWIDATGTPLGEALPDGAYLSLRISPDGRRAAVAVADVRTRVSDIYLADLKGHALSRFSFDGHDHGSPIWSRDGRTLAFTMDHDAPPFIFQQPVAGGAATPMTKPGSIQTPNDWSRDGRLFYRSAQSATGYDIYVRTADGQSHPWLQTPTSEQEARLSPDERLVSYVSDATGRNEVYVTTADGRGEHLRVSVNGSNGAAWSPDGSRLWIQTAHEIFYATITLRGETIEASAPVRIFQTPDLIRMFDTSPDGRLLLITEAADARPMNVVVGWKKEIERQRARAAAATNAD